MVLDIKQLYRNIVKDPDVVVDNNTSKEELAMDMATQRAVQHERNIRANNLGSPISKLLQFVAKADEDKEPETLEDFKNLSFEQMRLISTQQAVGMDGDDLNTSNNAFRTESGRIQHAEALYNNKLRMDRIRAEAEAEADTPPSASSGSTERVSAVAEGETGPSDAAIAGAGAVNNPEFDAPNPSHDTERAGNQVDQPVVTQDAAVEDGDASHIFYHGGYKESDKEHIHHIREVDEAHDNKWSKALQELQSKDENPRVGAPPTAVFRTTGANKGSVNIKAARTWFKQNDHLKIDEHKLNLPASGTPMPTKITSGSEGSWSEKVHDILEAKGGKEWETPEEPTERRGRETAGATSPGFQKLDRKINSQFKQIANIATSEEQREKLQNDVMNQAFADEAERLNIDISAAGVRPSKSVPSSGPAAAAVGEKINEEHQKVIQDIATDDTTTDEQKKIDHENTQSTMQSALKALGIHVANQVDTDQTSEEAIEENTGRDVDTTDDQIKWESGNTYNHDLKNGQLIRDNNDDLYRVDRLNGFNVSLSGINEDGSVRSAGDKTINTDPTSPEYDKDTQYYPHTIGEGATAIDNHSDLIQARAGTQTRMDTDTPTPETVPTEDAAKPTLHQSGDSTNLIGNNSTIEHAATSEDGTHHELHLHEDGSATTRRVNTETGETTHTHYRKSADGSGGLQEALEAHNKSLTEGGLDEHKDLSEEAGKANDPLTNTQMIARYATTDLDTAMKREVGGTQQEWEKGLADSDKASEEPARAKQAVADRAATDKRFSDYFDGRLTEGDSGTADEGPKETTPPITGTKPRPGTSQSGFPGMPRSRPGTTPGTGAPTEPPKEEERTGPLEGQAQLPEDEEGGSGDAGGDGDGGGAGTGGTEDEGGGEDDDKTPPIEGVKGKGGQYRFRGASDTPALPISSGGMPRPKKGAKFKQERERREGKPDGSPEDTRRGVDVAAEAQGLAPESGEQLDMFGEEERGKTLGTERTQSELGDEEKSRVLDIADRNGTFEYLHDIDPYNNSSPQEARKKLAGQDIADLKTTLGKHHNAARTHLLSKLPEEEPAKEDRNEIEEHLAQVQGTTADDNFRKNYKHHSTEELKAEIKAAVKANIATQKNTKTAEVKDKAAQAKQTRLSLAQGKVQNMQDLPLDSEGNKTAGPIRAQQRMREVLNIMHNHAYALNDKSRGRLSALMQDAVAHGADLESLRTEIYERTENNTETAFDDNWVEESAKRSERDQAEHDEHHRHMTGAEGRADRAEAFERSNAGTLVQTDEEGNVTGSTHTAADYAEPVEGKGDRVLDHHGGHDEGEEGQRGKPKMYGENKPPKLLGQNPEQKEAQKAHHEAVQTGDTATQQRIEAEEGNAHLAGTSKSEAELEEERMAAGKPPGPPPTLAGGGKAEWNPSTKRWCNPATLRGIQSGLGNGDVAVMHNGIHAGTSDAHLDDPNNLSTHSPGGHRGPMNVDGTHAHGPVVISQHGTHAAALSTGPNTAATAGPIGHTATAQGAMGAGVAAHMKDNPDSHINPDGSTPHQVTIKGANKEGSPIANTGVFDSKSHASTPKAGSVGKVVGSALNIFRGNRAKGSTPLTKSILIAKTIKPKKKATSKDILFRSGELTSGSKHTIKEQIKNAQLIREIENIAYGSQKKQ
tara:strand:+ start:1770 stop:6707 length:4938 start_codon:yes stop_codon:yes gene_type:complete